jgi:hypothetical protein
VLRELLSVAAPVFPVVEDLNQYSKSVPSELHPINGKQWKGNEDLPSLINDVLISLRLTRELRKAFISYRRIESSGLAVQLYSQMALQGYRPFLDTAVIPAGVDVQEFLWERMADVDSVVLLDSPKALQSKWVHEELARAHNLGLGVLQLIWPNHEPTPGTEFCDPLQLTPADFVNQIFDDTGTLTLDALRRVIAETERTRNRSLRMRRLAVVNNLVDQAKRKGLDSVVQPVGAIELHRQGSCVAKVIPVVGLPDALIIHRHEIGQPTAAEWGKVRVTYNGLGMSPGWDEHLSWLNNRERLSSTQVDKLEPWLNTL